MNNTAAYEAADSLANLFKNMDELDHDFKKKDYLALKGAVMQVLAAPPFEESEYIRYMAKHADGLPLMIVSAHPSTSGAVLVEMLQEAIENIKQDTRPGAKVVNMEDRRHKHANA
jgi:hypothetical protein